MNIFIIHSGLDKEYVNKKKNEIITDCKKANVLLLEYRLFWKHEVKKLIKSAQMVLYIAGSEGYTSRNSQEIQTFVTYYRNRWAYYALWADRLCEA